MTLLSKPTIDDIEAHGYKVLTLAEFNGLNEEANARRRTWEEKEIQFSSIQDPSGINFECKKCGETDEVRVTVWHNGIDIECERCWFRQFMRAEEPEKTYEDGDDE